MSQLRPKVLVSGCFDLCHSGHVKFFKDAAEYGDLYVCVGTDANINKLKGRPPMFPEQERLYVVQSVRYVTEARLSSGSGRLDFEPDLLEIKPQFFVVNEDGHVEDKRLLCEKYGVKYVVLQRLPETGLPVRSSTDIKKTMATSLTPKEPPYRICLCGGWMDQPWVSSVAPGSVVVFSIHPSSSFNLRAGMATSSRELWKGELWDKQVFLEKPAELARLLFGYENPPGSQYISGSQDHIGLVFPGINRLYYTGKHWPEKVDSVTSDEICVWLESVLVLVEISARPDNYDPLLQQNLSKNEISLLGKSGDDAWDAILGKDAKKLGESVSLSHKMWKEILPLTWTAEVENYVAKYKSECYGMITSGCGGGYLILVVDPGKEIDGAFRVKIRR